MQLRSDEIREMLEESARVEVVDLPLPPQPFSYRIVRSGSFSRAIPTKAYQEYKEQVLAWIKRNVDPPKHYEFLAGICYDHVFQVPKSAPKKYLDRIIEQYGESAGPTTVNKGDVHDNLNKAIPDVLMELGWLEDDSSIFYCQSSKLIGFNPGVTFKLYYLTRKDDRVFNHYTKKG